MPTRFVILAALSFTLFLLSACAESTGTTEGTSTEPTTLATSTEPAPPTEATPTPPAAPALETATSAGAAENAPSTPRPPEPPADRVSPAPAQPTTAAAVKKNPPSPPARKDAPQPTIASTETSEKAPVPATPTPPATPSPPDHSAWDQLLRQYVSAQGKVNYSGLLQQKEQLTSYLDRLAQAVPASDWSRQEAMAYWINAYNAYTIKLILDNWPVKSIKDTRGGTPWDDKWIELAGKKYSLNQIENDILRPKFNDARIHFAVNCAAVSCPPLHNRAFTAANLNSTLEQLARSFINNERYNTISAESATVSKVFDWYGQDFGTLYQYLDKYAKESLSADTQISFKEYDWALNN